MLVDEGKRMKDQYMKKERAKNDLYPGVLLMISTGHAE
jgi:hypothetical protein